MDYATQQRSPRRHLGGIGAVVVLHLALVWALQNGLAHKMMSIVKKPIDARLLEEVKPPPPDKPPEPAPPPQRPPPPPDFVPPPEIAPIAASPAPANAIAAVTRTEAPPVAAPPPPPPAAAKPAVHVAPVVTAASCVKPDYPAAARRAEEEGTVVLNFLVGEDGRVIESKVQTSSGSSRLDEAARSALSRCLFKPGAVDGQPEKAWANLKYTWKLE